MRRSFIALGLSVAWAAITGGRAAEVRVVCERNQPEDARAEFRFGKVPFPAADDDAAKAKLHLVDGRRDRNSGDLEKLVDGRLPYDEDEPRENFFFAAGTEGGRILFDLGSAIEVREVRTYSWDPNTRPKEGVGGGQHGVAIAGEDGAMGTYRYLLFDIFRTEADDPFGNTFYSEIDVSEAPDLAGWAKEELAPVVRVWYLKIAELLGSEGFAPPGYSPHRLPREHDRRRGDARRADPTRCEVVPREPEGPSEGLGRP